MTCQARPGILLDVSTQAAATNRDDERIRGFGLLHEAHRRLDRALSCSLEQACGISGPFFEVLLRVGRSPGGRLNMSELAQQLGLTSGGTTRLVDRVVAAGLVERESCPSDRRVQWVVLSDAGERKLDEALVIHLQDLQRELFDRLEPGEITVLERALDKLRAVDELPG
jgi:DNA-binding MarR family transcriptional regulator